MIPLVAKADSHNEKELKQVKLRIINGAHENNIKFFDVEKVVSAFYQKVNFLFINVTYST